MNDGQLSVEHHLEVYADDLVRLANSAENMGESDELFLEQTMDGIEYLLHIRIDNGMLTHLDIELCRKLVTGLLVFIGQKETPFFLAFSSDPSSFALRAFRILVHFLISVRDFKTVLEGLEAHTLRNALKLHRHLNVEDAIAPPSGYQIEDNALVFRGLRHCDLVAVFLEWMSFHTIKYEGERWASLIDKDHVSAVRALMKRDEISKIATAEVESKDSASTAMGQLPSPLSNSAFVQLIDRFHVEQTLFAPKGAYYDTTESRLLAIFKSDTVKGLFAEDAARRLDFYGPNAIPVPDPVSFWTVLFRQLKDFIVIVLILAAVVSAAIGDIKAMVVLFVVVVINTSIGFYQELSAEKTLDALSHLTVPTAKVIRGGETLTIDAGELVPGDIVVLEEGDAVPADLRIVESAQLSIVETSLTGESVAVSKSTAPIRGHRFLPVGDRTNMAFMSTTVLKGRGKGIVVNTGKTTEVGRISSAIVSSSSDGPTQTPLQRKLAKLAKILVAASIIGCVLVVIAGVSHGQGADIIFTAVALAVSVIPEGLQTVVTLTLSLGVRRMAKSNAIVRKLPAVETLGSTTTICSDKTGTLTQNKMKVSAVRWSGLQVVLESSMAESLSASSKPMGHARRPSAGRLTRSNSGTMVNAVPTLRSFRTVDAGIWIDCIEQQRSSVAAGGGDCGVGVASVSALLCSICSLCNNASFTESEEGGAGSLVAHGDPTEVALLEFAQDRGFSRANLEESLSFRRLFEIPFDSDRKRMSIIISVKGSDAPWLQLILGIPPPPEEVFFVLFLKGAPEEVVHRCSRFIDVDVIGEPSFDSKNLETSRAAVFDKDANFEATAAHSFEHLSSRGLRVLGMACRVLSEKDTRLIPKHSGDDADVDEQETDFETDLVFVGMAGMLDPPRPEVPAAIAKCHSAGVRVCMITGDHVATATAIASAIGLFARVAITDPTFSPDKYVVTGPYLASLSDEQLAALNPFPVVFSRVSPENKLKIVKALQRRGEIVAMGGDGVNDAPAIKQADCGFAMGKAGTELARQAADLVLLDDSFATIVQAIAEGRRIWDNIVKFIVYLLSCNSAEVIFMLIAVAIGWDPPMTSIMILYANIIADIPPSLSLGTEPEEPGVMERVPRDPHEHVLTPVNCTMLVIEGLLMAMYALLEFWLVKTVHGESLAYSRTAAFTLLTVVQIFHSFLCRSITGSVFGVFETLFTGNPWMLAAYVTSNALLLLGIYTPHFNEILDLEPLYGAQWIEIAVAVAAHCILVEIAKLVVRLFVASFAAKRRLEIEQNLIGSNPVRYSAASAADARV
eukprot:ANDGO_06651.mRNA.1 Calcium-transporting ATPase